MSRDVSNAGDGSQWGQAMHRVLSASEWETFFTKTPCVKQSLVFGVGCAAAMLAHKLHIRSNTKV